MNQIESMDGASLPARAPLQYALAQSGLRRMALEPELEAAWADHRRMLSVMNLRANWLLVMAAVALIGLVTYSTGIADDRMRDLVMIGYVAIFAVIATVGVGAVVESLNPHIDTLVGIASFVGLTGMQVGAACAEPGTDLRAIAEYGVVFISIALCTVSGLSLRQALVVGVLSQIAVVVVSHLSPNFSAWFGGALSQSFEPLLRDFAPDWHRYFFYGPAALVIGGLIGLSHEVRERTVFLQEKLLSLEKAELDLLTRELSRISRQDALTGLANRRHFDEVFSREWSGALREGRSMNALFIDVDYFKRYNDHYGHQAGDECLARVAGALASQAKRGSDFIARYGGEEFVAFFPRTNSAGLLSVAQRMIDCVDALQIAHEKSDAAPHVTISVGVGLITPVPGQRTDSLVEAADAALYRAKQRGRHRFCVSWED